METSHSSRREGFRLAANTIAAFTGRPASEVEADLRAGITFEIAGIAVYRPQRFGVLVQESA